MIAAKCCPACSRSTCSRPGRGTPQRAPGCSHIMSLKALEGLISLDEALDATLGIGHFGQAHRPWPSTLRGGSVPGS